MKAAILAENRDTPAINVLPGVRSGIAWSMPVLPAMALAIFPTIAQTVAVGENFTPNGIGGFAH